MPPSLRIFTVNMKIRIHFTFLILLFASAALAQSNLPGNKEFVSSRKFFRLYYPDEWYAYENPDGTYHFELEVYGTGTFEIKESRNFSDSAEIMHYLDNESFSHPNAKYQYNGNKTILQYNSTILVEGKETMVFVWLVANRNTVLTCRYLVDNKLKTQQKAQEELLTINMMVNSITFLQ